MYLNGLYLTDTAKSNITISEDGSCSIPGRAICSASSPTETTTTAEILTNTTMNLDNVYRELGVRVGGKYKHEKAIKVYKCTFSVRLEIKACIFIDKSK